MEFVMKFVVMELEFLFYVLLNLNYCFFFYFKKLVIKWVVVKLVFIKLIVVKLGVVKLVVVKVYF